MIKKSLDDAYKQMAQNEKRESNPDDSPASEKSCKVSSQKAGKNHGRMHIRVKALEWAEGTLEDSHAAQ